VKAQLFNEISMDLTRVEADLLQVVSTQDQTLADIGTHLLKAGGKRLRPALFLLAAKTHTYDFTRLLPVAVALELIHMATLVHDDVIDEAQTRRGFTTANTKWGNLTAVLAGDCLFAQSFATISHIADPRIIGTLSQLVSYMCAGEIIQTANTYNVFQTEEDYLARIEKKTANFIAGACELGTYMSAAPETFINAMRDYGHCLGMAFQITDDILDVVASDAQIGKTAGNDLKQGIMTLPIIYALHNSPDRDELCELIGRREMQALDLVKGLEIIRATDAVDYAYGLVNRYIQRSKERISVVRDHALRDSFSRIADFVGQRTY